MLRSVALVVIIGTLVGLSESKIHPRSAYREVAKKLEIHRRQTPEQDACVDAKLEEKLNKNSTCIQRVADLESVVDAILEDTEDDQSAVNLAFQILCLPECGPIFLEAEDECGLYDDSPGSRNFFVGLCGNNEGTSCYEYFYRALRFSADVSVSCYINVSLGSSCTCKSELASEVEVQGCCINVYQDFFQAVVEEGSGDTKYEPNILYGSCDVRQPNDCNNSPLQSSSVRLEYTILAVAAAFLLALFG
ncbi:hypothetical protein GBAR_LOCUS26258 [Geodia barretti]|uniref:Uncharacterized protein n=1 Tax=Geodia barretti TaxID=519541 RepID=A0AA35X7X7_GEOBA|nr:hypothetical protein GBAR_LOCUS26258 [Geodia barretti]